MKYISRLWYKLTVKHPQLPIENVTHVAIYGHMDNLTNEKIICIIHVPERRVSERRFNTSGALIKYTANVSWADAYIQQMCDHDPKIHEMVQHAEQFKRDDSPHIPRVSYMRRISQRISRHRGQYLILLIIWVTAFVIYLMIPAS